MNNSIPNISRLSSITTSKTYKIELPFREESFDLIIADGLLEYLPDNKKDISEFERLLKKDGILIFTIPNFFY